VTIGVSGLLSARGAVGSNALMLTAGCGAASIFCRHLQGFARFDRTTTLPMASPSTSRPTTGRNIRSVLRFWMETLLLPLRIAEMKEIL
jgi:hypothetical protein